MIKDIKNELAKRKEEQKQLETIIENEKQLLKEKREKESQGILHKSKTVHKIISNAAEKKDEKHIEAFIEEERRKLSEARALRKSEIIKVNKKKIILWCVAALAVIVAIFAIVGLINSHKEEQRKQEEKKAAEAMNAQMIEQYENAVALILEEKFNEAESTLKDTKVRDSEKLLEYVQFMQKLSDYQGNINDALAKVEGLAKFENSEVEKQRKNVVSNLKQAADIQNQIDAIVSADVDLSSKETISKIKEEIIELGEPYWDLLNLDKYDLAVKTIENIEQNNAVGQLIVAIRGLGTVTLDSESQVEELREKYSVLSASEKKQVVNYTTLLNARSRLDKLKKDQQDADPSIIPPGVRVITADDILSVRKGQIIQIQGVVSDVYDAFNQPGKIRVFLDVTDSQGKRWDVDTDAFIGSYSELNKKYEGIGDRGKYLITLRGKVDYAGQGEEGFGTPHGIMFSNQVEIVNVTPNNK